jgi:tetratricopeptide (TPR) repeat protein/protein involved in polysaccharide export with SLBB domain
MRKTVLFKLVLCVLSLAATSIGAPVRQEAGRASVYYNDGARYALEGRLEEAIAAFEQAIALDPKNGNTYYSLGNVYSELGRWTEAVAAYQRAVSLNDKDVEAYNGLGKALVQRGMYAQAVESFERATDIYPKWAEPHFHLSQLYTRLGQTREAQDAYRRAIRLRPDYATRPPQTLLTVEASAPDAARHERAVTKPDAASSTDRLPQAKAPATDATPNAVAARRAAGDLGHAKAYYDLGVKRSAAGQDEQAIAAFRQVVILDRNNAEAYEALGDAYARLGRWREAIDAYAQVARLNPQNAEVNEKVGRAYVKMRELASASPGAGESEAAIGSRAAAPSPASADTTPAATSTAAPNTSAPPTVKADAAAGVDPTTIYRVGAGDVLDIRVIGGGQTQTSSYKVTPVGLLDYPSLSVPLEVAGMTTDEIAARLGAELKRRALVANPEVVVGVREYASHAIIISGMVKEPGTKILQREGVPLYVIVAHAQPLAEAGRALVISHATGQGTTVDLSDVRAMNMLVRPGDVITVQPRPKQYFYIAGAVKEAGQKEFSAGLTLTQAVLTAGGLAAPEASAVTIARQGSDGRLNATRYNLREITAGRAPDPVIQPGDRIEVLR